eukprot:symbB.v1.2.012571.t1/scaffold873.1/size155814/5
MVLPVEGYQKAAGSMAFIVIVGIILVAKIGPSPVHLREDGERPPGHRVVVDDDVGDCDSAMRQAQQVSTLSQTPKAPLPSELPEASRLLNKIDVGAASSGRCPFGKVSKEVKNLAMAETQVKNTFIDVPSTATPIPSPPATAPARNAGATLKDSLQQAAEDIETAAPRNSTKNTPWKINIEHNHGGATHDPPALQPSARISGPAESASGSASGSADVGGRLEGTWVATAGRADSPQEAAPCDQMRGAQETGRKALPKEKWAAVIFAKRFLRYPPLNYQHSSHEAREMQKDINKHLAEWRLREQTEAEQAKKEKAAEKKRMNQELQRLRKEDRRSKLVEQETGLRGAAAKVRRAAANERAKERSEPQSVLTASNPVPLEGESLCLKLVPDTAEGKEPLPAAASSPTAAATAAAASTAPAATTVVRRAKPNPLNFLSQNSMVSIPEDQANANGQVVADPMKFISGVSEMPATPCYTWGVLQTPTGTPSGYRAYQAPFTMPAVATPTDVQRKTLSLQEMIQSPKVEDKAALLNNSYQQYWNVQPYPPQAFLPKRPGTNACAWSSWSAF